MPCVQPVLDELSPTEDFNGSVAFKLEGESDWSTGDATAKQRIEFDLVWRHAVDGADEAALDVRS